jgi:UDP-glucuronate decarboxylase
LRCEGIMSAVTPHQESRHVLVTGGAGFLGSHLVDRLLARGNRVTVIDNLLTGTTGNLIHHHNSISKLNFIEHDVTEPIDLEVDQIYNLACPASPIHYQADPIRTFKTSVIGAINVLELALKNKARIFQASTSEVYGDPHIHPQDESYWGNVNSFGVRACYDEGKRGAETLFFDYHRKHGVDIRLARIFNTYGPRMHKEDGRVVSNFIVQALSGESLTVYGDGLQTRSFCYVDDLVDGILSLMDSEVSLPIPINLGNSSEFTIAELAKLVLQKTKSKSELIYSNLPTDDPKQRKPNLDLAQKLLAYQPRIPLSEGLDHTIAYFQRVLARERN